MTKIFIFIFAIGLSNISFSESFTVSTDSPVEYKDYKLGLPLVFVDDTVYRDVNLLLGADGTWEVIDVKTSLDDVWVAVRSLEIIVDEEPIELPKRIYIKTVHSFSGTECLLNDYVVYPVYDLENFEIEIKAKSDVEDQFPDGIMCPSIADTTTNVISLDTSKLENGTYTINAGNLESSFLW